MNPPRRVPTRKQKKHSGLLVTETEEKVMVSWPERRDGERMTEYRWITPSGLTKEVE
jgi:hypothetical protein